MSMLKSFIAIVENHPKTFLLNVSFLALVFIYTVIWPLAGSSIATVHLRKVYDQQTGPLAIYVGALAQKEERGSGTDCYEMTARSYTRTELYCEAMHDYDFGTAAISESSREMVVSQAAALDAALQKNGWTADRQQDAIKTITASVLAVLQGNFQSNEVPFHKNIGDISCNLRINFDGRGNPKSLGAISVNQFSCQQRTSYFMPHFSKHVSKGFGG